MYKKNKISLIMPCYNEEVGLVEILKKVPYFFDEVIVVDNGSEDGTSKIAEAFGAKVIFEAKKGYGQAYKSGFSASSGDIIVAMDGDNSYPIEEAEKLISFLIVNNLDFVSGCRFPLKEKEAMNFLNRIGNWLLTLFFFLATFKKIKDSQSGMWVFKRSILEKMQLQNTGMGFSEEIKMEALLNPEIKFAEEYIFYKNRLGEVKLKKWKDGFSNLIFLFLKRLEILFRKKNEFKKNNL